MLFSDNGVNCAAMRGWYRCFYFCVRGLELNTMIDSGSTGFMMSKATKFECTLHALIATQGCVLYMKFHKPTVHEIQQ